MNQMKKKQKKNRKSMSKCCYGEQKTTKKICNFDSNKKLGPEWAVNGLGKLFRKIRSKKSKKTVKIRVKFPHVNKKPLPRNRIFVQTPFSHSTLKLEPKNSRRKTTRFLAPFPVSAWPKSPLQFDFKNHENVWTDLKNQRPNTIQILWIVKKPTEDQ